jgi:hypothetical protein
MSRHNIVGSEAFEPERLVYIKAYPRRNGGWRGYALAASAGGALTIAAAALLAYLGQMLA